MAVPARAASRKAFMVATEVGNWELTRSVPVGDYVVKWEHTQETSQTARI